MSEPLDKISVTAADGGLALSGGELAEQSMQSTEWMATAITPRKILLQATDDRRGMMGAENGLGQCAVDVFADFLFGLSHRRWSGVVSVDTGAGTKRIFFNDGEICFAASNVIDDRLGEVIYRDGLISLDQMVDSAVKVDRNTKFGQVLLSSHIFTALDLWNALKLQVQEIIRSVFLAETVYFELKEGRRLAPTEVVFSRGADELIEECYAYGKMYKSFINSARSDSAIYVNDDLMRKIVRPGTFISDFLLLSKENSQLSSLTASSKLSDVNTLAVLMNTVNLGLCQMSDDGVDDGDLTPEGLGGLKSRIDTYSVMLKRVKDAFLASKRDFPVESLRVFADSLNPIGFASLMLDEEGAIGKTCLKNIYSQCVGNRKRARFFLIRLESLIQFILQMSGDLLPGEQAKAVRQSYRSMVT